MANENQSNGPGAGNPGHEPQNDGFSFKVDDEGFSTHEHELKPAAILAIAGLDSDLLYLVEIRGGKQIPYKDAPDTPIKIHSNMEFISLSIGPKTTS